jgi:hypothetical protein
MMKPTERDEIDAAAQAVAPPAGATTSTSIDATGLVMTCTVTRILPLKPSPTTSATSGGPTTRLTRAEVAERMPPLFRPAALRSR